MFGASTCTYCGQNATTLDHVVPVVYMQSAPRARKKPSYSRDKVVPACLECNSLLSSFAHFTIAERAAFLQRRLSRRYKKLLNAPSWSEQDFVTSDVRGRLRQSIRASETKRKTIIKRLEHVKVVAAMSDLKIDDVWTQIDSS